MDDRIGIDEMMLEICDIISKRSTCLKKKFGCVIVKDGRIISMGYNGTLPGAKNCAVKEDCPRWDVPQGTRYELADCSHAEENAILFAAKNGISTNGAEMYINGTCCRLCARAIITAGIRKVVYEQMDYNGIELLIQMGIQVVKFQRSAKNVNT
jgi:dCMP deaminase